MKRIIIFTIFTLCTMSIFAQEAKVNGIRYNVISPTEAEVGEGNWKVEGDIIIHYCPLKKWTLKN